MNEWDRDNLIYMLSLSKKDFADWVLSLDSEDVDYAFWLMKTHQSELFLESLDLLEYEIDESFSDAKEVLFNVMKKVSK